MPSLRWFTAGESHGPGLTAIVEGMPAGVPLTADEITYQLRRRQLGYGRGKRQQIEQDTVEILGGVRDARTLGSPIAMLIRNKDWPNWENIMSVGPIVEPGKRTLTRARPGHADLAGGLKYGHEDLRNVLERSSARETAMRVAAGTVARQLLKALGIEIFGHVIEVGTVRAETKRFRQPWDALKGERVQAVDVPALQAAIEESDLRVLDPEAEKGMKQFIDDARDSLDSVGGIFEVVAVGVPPGLGSHVQWDRRLDGRIAQAMMSIQAMKGVSFGIGFQAGRLVGSEVQDEIFWSAQRGLYRETNRLGGMEGGMTNGEPVVVRVAMKPIPTLRKPLRSVDLATLTPFDAARERSDTAAIAATPVIGEAMLALVLADACLDKFGGDSLREIQRNYRAYLAELAERGWLPAEGRKPLDQEG